LADQLCKAGLNAIHVREIGMQSALDIEIFDYAAEKGIIIVSADTDFANLLAKSKALKPSFILFRCTDKSTDHLLKLLLSQLRGLEEDINSGSVIVFDDRRVRARGLPLLP
jgi:predicted nuclease of predicted toxin-antitoxin system